MYELPTFEELKRYRVKAGLTQAELARRATVSQSLIARIEAGDIDPRLSTLRKILGALRAEELGGNRTAGEIMKAPIIHVTPEETLGSASHLMEKHGISQLPVLQDGVQVGSISERKLVEKLALEKDMAKVSGRRVAEVMGEGFPTLGKEADIRVLSRLVESNPAILNVEKGKAVGIVTRADILRLMKKG
ncbi:MAG: CBS domain-containing protein [Euryarchaeota archaeon]|nr:CBS domain-containing protein [Euryarchaeota archaeon]